MAFALERLGGGGLLDSPGVILGRLEALIDCLGRSVESPAKVCGSFGALQLSWRSCGTPRARQERPGNGW
eukprot:6021341-Pyramimonas_sp.AAC.1